MKFHPFKSVAHATPTLAEAMERFRRTGVFILSTDNPTAYEYENTLPASLDLSHVSPSVVDPFAAAALHDNSSVGSVPHNGDNAPSAPSTSEGGTPSSESSGA